MTFDKILEQYGKISKDKALSNLTDFGDHLFGLGNWKFVHEDDSETITSNLDNMYYVTIADNLLYDNCDGLMCNVAGYVYVVKDMYHESEHVWQNTTAWNDKSQLNSVKSFRRTTNVVRREFVSQYFPSAYTNNYSNDPGEMDAERYAFRCALSYFESNPIITKTEAEEILYQFAMSEDNIHSNIIDMHRGRLHNIYDVRDLFDERADTVAAIKYEITENIDRRFIDFDINLYMTHEFLYSDDFAEYRKAYAKCNTGIEQDKVLEQAIIVSQRGIMRKSPPRLHKELTECRMQMDWNSLRLGLHAVPPKKINYSMQADELELTDEDLASIPIDDDLKL